MKVLILAALLTMFAGPAVAETAKDRFIKSIVDSETYFEIGAGKNGNLTACSICWNDGGGIGAYISIRNEWDNGFFIQLTHFSQYNVGEPFNFEPESTLDHVGAGMRWRIR
jgi:hypothetical protein